MTTNGNESINAAYNRTSRDSYRNLGMVSERIHSFKENNMYNKWFRLAGNMTKMRIQKPRVRKRQKNVKHILQYIESLSITCQLAEMASLLDSLATVTLNEKIAHSLNENNYYINELFYE